ncbi:MAG: NYN domain-containing protein [Bryobacteraceae bacterium]|nr:NYN domain-containing protein [Bryobacteraceae bacterium]
MQDRLNIAVFVDYDNIEIGLKSTLRREFDVALALDALKERGDIVAKFAYANWGRQEGATRQMAENAVQMVQRIPSPRGDKNGADINLALDALEMAFTHQHVNAFAIVSGDSDFIPLVNKLKEYGKTVFVVGGKAFTSTILQQNCHEFISFESLLPDGDKAEAAPRPDRDRRGRDGKERDRDRPERPPQQQRQRPAPLDLELAMPLVERALQVLERRNVQPQLGLLKSTMLQLDSAFSEKAYGAGSFSEFVEKLKNGNFVNVSGTGGRYVIERKKGDHPSAPQLKPEDALTPLRDVLENHRLECENGVPADHLAAWFKEEQPNVDLTHYGFQEFGEFLNYAQDKTVARVEIDEEKGVTVFLGAEFYPPAIPEPPAQPEEILEEDEPQPYVEGQPTIFEPNPPPPKPRKAPARKRVSKPAASKSTRPRRKKTD